MEYSLAELIPIILAVAGYVAAVRLKILEKTGRSKKNLDVSAVAKELIADIGTVIDRRSQV